MNIEQEIPRLASCIDIAHQIPGRIRFKLKLGKLGQQDTSVLRQAQDFLKNLGEIEGVRSIRLNTMALSCTVEYDATTIPPKAWPDLLQGKPSTESAILLRIVEQKYRELSQPLGLS
jgi:hypothetical protein